MSIADKIKSNLTKSSWIRKMFEEGNRLSRIHGPEKVFDFTIGNPDLEPPESFKNGLRDLALTSPPGIHRYMENAGLAETRQAVARHLTTKTGLVFHENLVVMTVGAGGGLNVVFKTLLDPGDEVIVSAPYFVEYDFYVDNHQGHLVVVPSRRPDFELNPEAVADAITPRTKVILLNSPNNPTGAVYSETTLKTLASLIRQKEEEYGKVIYLVSDEPYSALIYDGVELPLVAKIFPHSLIVTSHSKDLALPGERIGYIAVNPNLPEVGLIYSGLVFSNRILGFVNAPALMQRLVTNLQGQSVGVEIYQKRRDLLYQHLTAVGFKVFKPKGAFYLFPESPILDDITFIQAALRHFLLLVPGSGFGATGYFRIAYCVPEEMIINSLPAFTALAREFGMV